MILWASSGGPTNGFSWSSTPPLCAAVALAGQLCREMGVPMRLINLAEAELAEAVARGWGKRGSRVSMVLQQTRASVRIEVDPDRVQAILDADQTD